MNRPMNGYIYKHGKLSTIEGEHSENIGSIIEAIESGIVRIRDHGETVAFQGRTRALVLRAIAAFQDSIRIPHTITQEWPGHFSEITIR